MSNTEATENGRVRSRRRALWSKFWRVGLGSILVIAGIAMCVLPGPGLLTIIAGLAVMSDEVPPARRLMDKLKARARAAQERITKKVPH